MFLVGFGACSSRSVRISSNPEGAEVSNLSGEKIGMTPLEVGHDELEKISENGLATFRVTAPGHLPRIAFVDPSVTREVVVGLPKTDSSAFRSEFMKDFGRDMNRMLRSAFFIQKLVGQKKFDEASKEIESFKEQYPSLAYSHVISAQISLAQGRREEARTSLVRAGVLDPDDSGVQQSLKLMGVSASSPTPSPSGEQR